MKPHHSIPKEGIYHDGLIEDCSDKRCNPRNMTRELDLSRQIPPRYVTDAEAEWLRTQGATDEHSACWRVEARLLATREALLQAIDEDHASANHGGAVRDCEYSRLCALAAQIRGK